MKFRRHNPRVVALLIYALLVNLAWFAAASARHVTVADAWCSTGSDSTTAQRGFHEHDGCLDFCGAHSGAADLSQNDAIGHLVKAVPAVPVAVSDVVAALAMPWQARGPPLG